MYECDPETFSHVCFELGTEGGMWAKKVEGSIAFISELILLRKAKLEHLSVSQIKRFSSRLQPIDWSVETAFLSLINQVNLPSRRVDGPGFILLELPTFPPQLKTKN